MDTDLKIIPALSEDEARAEYTKALTAFDAKAKTVEALRAELQEETEQLTALKQKIDLMAQAFLRAVEMDTFSQDMPSEEDAVAEEAKSKMDSITIGKIMGQTAHAPSAKTIESEEITGFEHALGEPEVDKYRPYAGKTEFVLKTDEPDVTGIAQEVSEADRDEDAIALAIEPITPGAERAANIKPLSEEKRAIAEDVLDEVNAILSEN